MPKRLYVVTGLELGWDCVVKVYDAEHVTYEEVEAEFPSDSYVINDEVLETKVEPY